MYRDGLRRKQRPPYGYQNEPRPWPLLDGWTICIGLAAIAAVGVVSWSLGPNPVWHVYWWVLVQLGIIHPL